jgi:hypothetical protein
MAGVRASRPRKRPQPLRICEATVQEQATTLGKRLRDVAKGRRDQGELEILAADFDSVANGFFGQPQTVTVGKFLATYAKTRRRYCEITGEDLV